MQKATTFLLLCLIITACSKDGLEQKKLYIRGRLFLTDMITQNLQGVPLANQKVTLAENSIDTLNYAYSETTDKEGYFTFVLLDTYKEKPLTVRFNGKISSYWYIGKADVKGGDNSVILEVSLNENIVYGFSLLTKDDSNGILPRTSVRLFGSTTTAQADDPTAAIFVGTSDSLGKISKLDIPTGTYYINASRMINSTLYKRISKTITIVPKSILRDTIRLTP